MGCHFEDESLETEGGGCDVEAPLGGLIDVLVVGQLLESGELFFFAAFLDEQCKGVGDVSAVGCRWDVCQS